ncbi:MAG: tetratricopeptide repeat protein, partial [Shewanella sp.]
QSYTYKEAALYGKALALFRLKKFAESEKIIDELLSIDSNNLFYIDTKSDLLVERQDHRKAITMLETQRKMKPTSQVINTNLANIYIEAGEPAKAIPLLEDMIFLDKQNQLPYQLLNLAYKKIGNQGMEYFSNAELMALGANYKGAIDQLNFAYRASEGNPLQLARIEARIRQFKQADKELEALK